MKKNVLKRLRLSGTVLSWILLLLVAPVTNTFAQNRLHNKVTITFNKQPLGKALQQLQEQSKSYFAFIPADVQRYNVSASTFTQTPLSEILRALLKNTTLTFKEEGNYIIIAPAKPVADNDAGKGEGQVRGRVVDFETSQPLPGATVLISGSKTGTQSNEKGFYELKHLASGKYTLEIRYIGYSPTVLNNVSIQAGKEVVLDVKMEISNKLNEVVIGAGPRKVKSVTHSTEAQLIDEIHRATGVVSGISSELITKTADRNAAEIVKRISGVTVVDDRFIVVRGMNERYNLTFLNNSLAPSTELYSKAFAYDLLPSSVIDKILVYKSPVADLVADYAGAAVKITTKNAMPLKHFDMGLQLAHREGATFKNSISYNGGKYDVLGFDDGGRKLPSFSPGIFESNRQVTNVKESRWLSEMSPALDYGTHYSLPDMQLFANYYNSWKVGNAKLYDLTAFTYTKETVGYDFHLQKGNTDQPYIGQGNGNAGGSLLDNNKIGNGQQSSENAKINILENLTLKLNDRHQLFFRNFFVNDGRRFTSVNTIRPNQPKGIGLNINEYRSRDIVLSFQQRTLYAGHLGGSHLLGGKKQHTLEWNAGYTYDLQNLPDQRLIHLYDNSLVDDTTWRAVQTNYLGIISRLYIKNLEQIYNGAVDYTYQVQPGLSFKAGTYNMFKIRQVGRRFFRVNRAGLTNDQFLPARQDDLGWYNDHGNISPELLRFSQQDLPNVWSSTYFKDDNTGLAIYDATSPVDAYVGSEEYHAGYLMGDWKTAREKLVLNGGLRLEYDRQRLSGAREGYNGPTSLQPIYVNRDKTVLLPSVNISYLPSSSLVFRGSYGRTVNRPDFREMTPYTDFDFQNNENIMGYPRIVTAVIDNYDIRAELYPKKNKNEVLNVGFFYKHLQNPIERMRRETSASDYGSFLNFTNITYINSVSADIYGVEAEIKKSLSFIGGNLFRHFSVVLNGSLLKSSTVTHGFNTVYVVDSIHKKGEPLQGQSPYVVNAGLFYENPSIGTKASLVYNVSGPRIYAKSQRTKEDTLWQDSYIRPDLLQLPMHLLDLSVTQRIVKSLQVKFSVQNLLDQSYRIVEDLNYNQRYDAEKPVEKPDGKILMEGDNIYKRYKPGRYWLLQFTYSF
ncbi:TonB-dependent receptor [Chitinophaga flava]|uniref:TonB-dependent receptor n=1 Tax=Chitinophaga flava TaxID=2259036 RepID=A0A365XTF8_9BACT|nr:TonB-dependent receptor [Chitinophaga flava]RBL89301.1 TonB-dependent receptor [Chitinophaga flava]